MRARGYNTLIIVGLTTPHCVSTTTRMAGNLGFHTYLVADATAAFDMVGHDGRQYTAQEIHAVSLVTVNGEFATIVELLSLKARGRMLIDDSLLKYDVQVTRKPCGLLHSRRNRFR